MRLNLRKLASYEREHPGLHARRDVLAYREVLGELEAVERRACADAEEYAELNAKLIAAHRTIVACKRRQLALLGDEKVLAEDKRRLEGKLAIILEALAKILPGSLFRAEDASP